MAQWSTWSINVSFLSRKAPSHLVDWFRGPRASLSRLTVRSSPYFLVKNYTFVFFGLKGEPSISLRPRSS